MTKEEIWNLVVDKTLEYGPKVLLAIVVLLIGLRIIKVLARLTEKGFNKRTDDPTLGRFMNSMIAWTLKVLLFVSVAAMLGIETTSFVRHFGSRWFSNRFSLTRNPIQLCGRSPLTHF